MPAPITDLTLEQLHQTLQEWGQPRFRLTQLLQWIYFKRISDFDQLKNVPGVLRQRLAAEFSPGTLRVVEAIESARGDAVKFAFDSGETVCFEAVLLIDGKRRTACLSSQLGCDLGCVFCATGSLGLVRNLTQHEILGQLIAINNYLAARNDKPVTNIVFMGMGEALSNYPRFVSSMAIITHHDAFNLAQHRVTVSTAGVVPSIVRLMESGLKVGLAISLNTYSNAQRDTLMPINRHYPIETLVAAARDYARATGEPVTFEYVLIAGRNDSDEAIGALARLLRGCTCKVNVIPLNPGAGGEQAGTPAELVDDFAARLNAAGVMVTVRRSRGQDISGACGQLAGRLRKAAPLSPTDGGS